MTGVDQITTAIQSINKNAQNGSARSEELSATALALREQAGLVANAIGELERVAVRQVAVSDENLPPPSRHVAPPLPPGGNGPTPAGPTSRSWGRIAEAQKHRIQIPLGSQG